jgi:hypothetical protein
VWERCSKKECERGGGGGGRALCIRTYRTGSEGCEEKPALATMISCRIRCDCHGCVVGVLRCWWPLALWGKAWYMIFLFYDFAKIWSSQYFAKTNLIPSNEIVTALYKNYRSRWDQQNLISNFFQLEPSSCQNIRYSVPI